MKQVLRIFCGAVLLMAIALFSACQSGGGQSTTAAAPAAGTVDNSGFERIAVSGKSGWEKATKISSKDQALEEGYFVNGQRHGTWLTYHAKNGLVATSTSYENGVKNGAYLEINDRGNLEVVANYLDGNLSGPYKKFNRTKVKEETNYVNGQLDGNRKLFYDNGDIQEESAFAAGKREGTAKWYDQEGNVKMEYQYKNGERVKE